MKKLICLMVCAMLALVPCALAGEQTGELPLAASLKAYLPTVGWEDYTAQDTDGDGYEDEFMISYDSEGANGADTIDVYCQCFDGAGRVVCNLAQVPEGADPLKVYEQVNEFNANLTMGRWIYDEEAGVVRYCQEIYDVVGDSFGAYAFAHMEKAASYVYSFYERFTAAIA